MTMHSILGLGDTDHAFVAMAHYARSSDQMISVWASDHSVAESVSGSPIMLLRSTFQRQEIVGAKVKGMRTILPALAQGPVPPLDRSKDEDADHFKPYAAYDGDKQALVVRWLPGKVAEERLSGERTIILYRPATNIRAIAGFALLRINDIVRPD